MAVGDPQVGEKWSTRDLSGREMQAFMADITPHIVTLVSITGNRIRVAPARLQSDWSFLKSAPRTGLICERKGCSFIALFRTTRDGHVQHLCPRHAPIGVLLHVVDETRIYPRSEVEGITCLVCGTPDVPEDMGALRSTDDPWQFWNCTRCDSYWVSVDPRPEEGTSLVPRAMVYLEGRGCTIDRVFTGEGLSLGLKEKTIVDPLLPRYGVQILLRRKTKHNLKPPMPIQKLGGAPQTTIEKDRIPAIASVWRHLITKQVVEVTSLEGAVHFKPLSGGGTTCTTPADFLRYHESYEAIAALPDVRVGEEWENGIDIFRVVSFDAKRQVVILQNPYSTREIDFQSFANGQWSRATRKTMYDMLLED